MSLTLHGGLLSHPVRIMDGVIFPIYWSILAVLGLPCCVGFPLAAASGAPLWLRCVGLSLRWYLLLRSTGLNTHGLQ